MRVCPDGFVTMELAAQKLGEVLAKLGPAAPEKALVEAFAEAVRNSLAGPGAVGQPLVLLAIELKDVEDALREDERPLPAGDAARAREVFLGDWENAIEFSSIPEALDVVIESKLSRNGHD